MNLEFEHNDDIPTGWSRVAMLGSGSCTSLSYSLIHVDLTVVFFFSVHYYWWVVLQNSQIRATSHTTFDEIFSGKYHWKLVTLLLTRQKSLLVCVVVWMLLSNQVFELKWNGGNGCGSGLLGATSNKQVTFCG